MLYISTLWFYSVSYIWQRFSEAHTWYPSWKSRNCSSSYLQWNSPHSPLVCFFLPLVETTNSAHPTPKGLGAPFLSSSWLSVLVCFIHLSYLVHYTGFQMYDLSKLNLFKSQKHLNYHLAYGSENCCLLARSGWVACFYMVLLWGHSLEHWFSDCLGLRLPSNRIQWCP